MKKFLLTALLLVMTASAALGQMDTEAQKRAVEAQRTAMKALDLWPGKWEGSGWMQYGPQRESFTGSEVVQRKIDGLALLVEGKFTNKDGVVIHETLAVLSYNQKTKNYDFNTFLASGNKGLFELRSTADGFQWDIPFPAGKMRYTTKLSADTWFEVGEMSRDDGKTWTKFFEMNLKRIK